MSTPPPKAPKPPACQTCGATDQPLTPALFCVDWKACDERRKENAQMRNRGRDYLNGMVAPVPMRARVWLVARQKQHYFRRVVTEHASSEQCPACGQMHISGQASVRHEHLELVPEQKEATVFTGEEATAIARDWGARVEAV